MNSSATELWSSRASAVAALCALALPAQTPRDAKRELQAGDPAQALELLREVIAGRSPTASDRDLWLAAAMAAAQQGVERPRELMDTAFEAARTAAPAQGSYVALLSAQLAETTRDYSRAARDYRFARAGEATPDADYRHYATSGLITVLVAAGRLDEALDELDKLETLSSSDAELRTLRLRRAEVFLQVGWMEAASRELGSVDDGTIPSGEIARDGHVAQLYWLDVELWSEQFDRARERAEAVLDTTPFRSRVQIARAIALDRLADPAAEPALRELLEADHPDHRALAASVLIQRSIVAQDRTATRDLIDRTSGWSSRSLLAARARAAIALDEPASRIAELAASLAAEWQTILQSWRAVPLREGGTAFLQISARRELLAALFACRIALDPNRAPRACLGSWLEADALATAPRTLRLEAMEPADVQQLAPRGGALCCFLPAPGGSFVITATTDDVRIASLPNDRSLRRRVQALRRALRARRPVSQLRSFARDLADTLGDGPWSAFDRVAISGRELLGGLPFESLPDGSSWLGLRCAVSYMPNLTLAHGMRDSTPGTRAERPEVAVRITEVELSDATADGLGLEPDLLAEHELEQIVETLRPSERVVTESTDSLNAGQLSASRAQVLALFAHGVYDGARACPAGVQLGAGPLFAEDCRHPSPADLILLCTCGAGRGSLRRGDDGARHLGGAFLRNGARVVGVADTDLEVERTITLVATLLQRLADGLAPDLALRDARIAMVEAGYDSPSDWAALRLEGLASADLRLPIENEYDSGWAPRISAVGSVLAVVLLIRRRRSKRGRLRSAAAGADRP